MEKMFCFQCEQTAGSKSCSGSAGVCGKKADTAKLQDDLTGALIGLAKAAVAKNKQNKEATKVIIEGLFVTITNVNFDNEAIQVYVKAAQTEKNKIDSSIQVIL